MNNRRHIIEIAVIALIVAAVAAGWYYRRYMSDAVVPTPGTYSLRGIDVSAHNGDIDFEKVAGDSIDFVFIKVSEGLTFRDPRFDSNYVAARRAGLKVGAYHFFRYDCDGRLQACMLLAALRDLPLDFPIAFDVEDSGNPKEYDRELVHTRLAQAIEHMRLRGREVIIYTNKDGYRQWVKGYHDDVPLWICSFTDPPLAGERQPYMWQYSHRGKVAGVSGAVDLDVILAGVPRDK